jgi:hypothetical protein
MKVTTAFIHISLRMGNVTTGKGCQGILYQVGQNSTLKDDPSGRSWRSTICEKLGMTRQHLSDNVVRVNLPLVE